MKGVGSLLLITLAATPVAQESGRAMAPAQRLGRLVQQLRSKAVTEVEAWARVDAAFVPALFEVWRDGAIPATWLTGSESNLELNRTEQTWLRGAIEDRPVREWVDFFESALEVPARTGEDTRAGIEILSFVGGRSQVPFLFKWARPEGDRAEVQVRKAVEDALVAWVRKDSEVVWVLRDEFAKCHESLLGSVLDAVTEAEVADSISVLSSVLGRVTRADHLVLNALAKQVREAPFLADEFACASVRHYLTARETTLVQAACLVLGAAQDTRSVEELIDVLDHDAPNVRAAAARSLHAITALVFGENQKAWQGWFEVESAWWRDEANAALSDLRRGDPAATVAALRLVAGKRLYTEELCDALIECLQRRSGAPASMICKVLVRVRSARVIPALVDALEHEDPAAAAAIHSSLVELTGRDMGPSRSDWWGLDG